MKLELEELKRLFDKAYEAGQITRENSSDDLVFYYITQWDDGLLSGSSLAYRGQFDILKKAGRDILSDLSENPIQIDFFSLSENSESTEEMVDGMYRTLDSDNRSQEAFEVGENESVVCGVGAWKLYTDYESNKPGNNNQVIKRKPIFEANNTVFWDPNAKSIDKSDAVYVFELRAYSEDGYKDLKKDLTGEEIEEIDANSFKHPEQSYVFPWLGGEGKKIYVGTCYYRYKEKTKILTMENPFGDIMDLKESDLTDVMDEMIEAGFNIVEETEKEMWYVDQYIMSGAEILDHTTINGEHIPIVPMYGEYSFVEGEPHYEGVVRLAKDPQRLRNFAMSYLGDILSRSPRVKPIYLQEQIAGFQNMYEESGAENNYPYLLMNRTTPDGDELPIGAIGLTPEQTVPTSLSQVLGETRAAVEDVASPGVVPDVADVDLSGKAINALNARIDKQASVYQKHKKHAKKRDAEIYLSMAKAVYDIPRSTIITLPDGTRKTAQVMQTVIDNETGDLVVLNDLARTDFEIFSDIGPSYRSQKEQTIDKLTVMHSGMVPGDPMRAAIELEIISLLDGVAFKDLREHARKQLILQGIKEPETDEEIAMLEQAQQQGQEPSAEMVLAMAEDRKAQAMEAKNQVELAKVQANAQNEQMKRVIDEFKAATERLNTQIDAQEAGANIDYKRVDTMGKELDNAAKVKELATMSVSDMTDDDLFKQMRG